MSDKRTRRIQTAFRDAENSTSRLSAKRALDRAVNEYDQDFEEELALSRKQTRPAAPAVRTLKPF